MPTHGFSRLDEAISVVASATRVELESMSVGLLEAVGLVAARSYESPIDIPLRDSSAVDGYAVRSVDTFGASPSSPVELELGSECVEGTAVRVLTGDPLPPGCDAVAMDEDVEVGNGVIHVYRPLPSYANVRRKGEDLRRGEAIVRRGQVLRPWHLAALAAVGVDRVEVFERVRIGVLVVGSEVAEPSAGLEAYERGLVLNSTGTLVLAALRELKFVEPRYLGIAPDDPREVARALRDCIDELHAVVTTGGTGPSERDVTPRGLEEAGGRVLVRGIAIRPGRPTSAGVLDGKPVFMLSGFPVAAYVGLRFFALPALARALGIELPRPRIPAVMGSRLASTSGYTCFARARAELVGSELVVEPLAIKGSGNVSTLLRANCIIEVPEGVEGFEKGDRVLIDPLWWSP